MHGFVLAPGMVLSVVDMADVPKFATKLGNLFEEIGPVHKDGTNLHFRYNFVSYEGLALVVRAAMQKVGLTFLAGMNNVESVVMEQRDDGKAPRSLTTGSGSILIMDVATGATMSIPWAGQGADNEDKGAAKALTSGIKYALMRMLLVSDKEELDSDNDGPSEQQTQQRQSSQQSTQRSSQGSRQSSGRQPADPLQVKTRVANRMAEQMRSGKWTNAPADNKLIGAVASRMSEVFPGQPTESVEMMGHQLVQYLFGATSYKDLTDAQGRAVLGWSSSKGADGTWSVPDTAIAEAANILIEVGKANGQEEMPF